ncbi:MAG TPA: EamA family transporter [Bacillota bacterium]|nr:EamA family transporter [Bacillota bacterium]
MVYVLAFIGMFCWGVAPLFVKLGLQSINPLVGLAIRTTFTIIIIFSWMLMDGSFLKLKYVSSSALLLLAIEAVLATLVGDLAYFAAIKRGEVSLVTIIMACSPLITIACSILFLGEQVTVARMIGAGLIIVGIVMAT